VFQTSFSPGISLSLALIQSLFGKSNEKEKQQLRRLEQREI
jgi:hypothetical protein